MKYLHKLGGKVTNCSLWKKNDTDKYIEHNNDELQDQRLFVDQ